MPSLIEILVAPEGTVRIETRGFTGPTCQAATRALERALGLTIHEVLTAEYHLPAAVAETSRIIPDVDSSPTP